MRIKSFEQYVFESFDPINEGGKVFDEATKIRKEDVDGTIKDIEENLFSSLGLELGKNVIRLGSAGHADLSGDIDFGVIGIPLENLHETVKVKFPKHEINFMKGLEVLSITWPIKGQDESLVQVDLIPVYNKDWTEFVYRYPEGSKYKSAHRNWMFMSILSAIRLNVERDPETDEPVTFDGYMMNLNKGLFSIKKDYHGKTKILKHGQIVEEKLITMDPDKFVKFVFGENYWPKDVETFEDCLHITKKSDFKWSDEIDDIKKNLRKFLDRVKLPIPKELDE